MSCNSENLPYITEETYNPIIDSLGPFHDETILSSIDKLLYLMGVHKMAAATKSILRERRCGETEAYETCDTFRSGVKSISSTCATGTCFTGSCRIPAASKCSLSKRSAHKVPSVAKSQSSHHHVRLSTPPTPKPSSTVQASTTPSQTPAMEKSSLADSVRFLEHPLVQDLICPICGGYSNGKPDTSKLQTMIRDYEEFQTSPVKVTLRRSFSSVYRKLKKVFSDIQGPKIHPDMDWFWTRRREEGDHQILEIYENSDLSKHPSQARLKENLSLILIVMPSGVVIPFEPVKNPASI